ncbi:MAG: leucine-rich repeat protein [Spirochaetaceae bacterium]|nr:leucine-rich repeat protein [Spirochaetaceae bacterium]
MAKIIDGIEYSDDRKSVVGAESRGITESGECAVLGCSSLSSVEIPQSVTKIGWSAFGWCDALSSVVFAGTKAEWNAVEKERYWLSEYSAIECVQCADGVVKR